VFSFQGFSPDIPGTYYDTFNSLVHVVYVIKFYDREKMYLEILTNLQDFTPCDYEKIVFGIPSVFLCVYLYVCMYVCRPR
jgi:hypothetical protein